jgi:hypothetical protein
VLSIVMTTYSPFKNSPREAYADVCINSIMENLIVPGGVKFVFADDGSADKDYLKRVVKVTKDHYGTLSVATSFAHRGIGASLNTALQTSVNTNYWMYTTDDWRLIDKLNLNLAFKLLNAGYDLVRLGPIHPNLSCETKFNVDNGWWLDVHNSSGYAFATRPFVATKAFYNRIGQFDEMPGAYETERLYAERVNKSKARIACYPDIAGSCWSHIGEFEVGRV